MQNKVVMQCIEVVRKNPWVKLFHFKVLGDADLESWLPGKHVNLYYPCAAAIVRKRSYSLTAHYETGVVEILVQKSHENGVSSFLHSNLRKGDIVFSDGVGGDVTVERFLNVQKVLMLAAGIGVTLPLAILRQLKELHEKQFPVPEVSLLLSISRLEELSVLDELLILVMTCSWFKMKIFVTKETLVGEAPYFKAQRLNEASVLDALCDVGIVLVCGGVKFTGQMKEFVARSGSEAEVIEESFYLESVAPVSQESDECRIDVKVDGEVRSIQARKGDDVLTSLLSNGFQVKHKCRSGICGQCSIKRLSGSFRYEETLAEPINVDEGGVLACCSYPADDRVEVELL